MSLGLIFEWMLVLTAFCANTTAVWLWWHARFRPLLTSLAGFCLMLALWSFGHLALLHDFPLLGKALILANPLMPTFYLQFALHFVVDQRSSLSLQRLKTATPLLFLSSLLVVLLSWSTPSATVQPAAELPQFFLFQGFGWINLGYTVAMGVLAHWVLWQGWRQHQGNKRRSVAAISMTAALGLLLASSFVFPSVGLDWYPYPMLLLPGYLLLLIYSVVRYQMLAVNAFASRALLMLVMALLLLLLMALISVLFGQFGMPALATVPGWQLWLYSSLLLLLAAACYQPASRLAERLIYPGVQLSQAMVSQWQQLLSDAADWPALCQQAQRLLQQPLQQPLWIEISHSGQVVASAGDAEASVRLCCQFDDAHWRLGWQGQDELTPSMRLTCEILSSLLQSSCASLQQALALAAAEKQRLSQQHLVELGALAAAMAHELRNPLNIISMASAGVDAELRGHIQSQLKRADRLIADMLVYAGQLQIQPQSFLLKAQLQSLCSQFDWQQVEVSLLIAEDLSCEADPHRLQQVLINLIDNALAFLRNQSDGQLLIEARMQHDVGQPHGVLIRLHNNGPALDQSLQDTLFRPFVSKRAGGSGLGLAIVQRIIDAHHGRISHRADLGWPVSFEIWLPKSCAVGVEK
jgi:signal transduction histidine kinase